MEQTFEDWNESQNDAELQLLKKSLKKRNHKLILTSTLVVLTLLLFGWKILLPAVEQQYWDPTMCTYLEDTPDTELTLSVYTELFGHGKILMMSDIQKTGFASYAIDTYYLEWESLNSLTALSYRHASLNQGQWNEDAAVLGELPSGVIYRDPAVTQEDFAILAQEETVQRLQELPHYVQVLASVTFSKDLSMKQLDMLRSQYRPRQANFIWAALRTGERTAPPCGVHFTDYESSRYQPEYWDNTAYPELFPERLNWSYESIEQHVLSMLRFSADQVGRGTGLVPNGTDEGYYQRALAYMEETGVTAYGCYLIATPETLLDLLEESSVACIRLEKAWIGV